MVNATNGATMKKICFFINSGWYFELHWLERAKCLLEEGFQVHIISHFNESEIERFSRSGLYCHNTNMRERSLNPFAAAVDYIKITRLLRNINPSLIHAITIKPILIAGFYARLKKIPFVASFVGLGRVFMYETPLFKMLSYLVCKCYDFIFKNIKSRLIFEHAQDLQRLTNLVDINKSQCSVIDGVGINIDSYFYCKEEVAGKPIVLFAGRMLRSKGLEVLVDINKNMQSKGKGFRLNVAGIEVPDDPDSIPHSVILDWHNAGFINWLGKRDDVGQLIQASHIIALPSVYFEGVPRILIEGASKGRACIAFDSGGCSSIIADGINGFLIPCGDKSAFEKKLLILLTNSQLRHEMGIAGRRIVEERFSSEMVLKKTTVLYSEIL